MYTSTYSSSPVRTFAPGISSTNHQQQSFNRQYTQPSSNDRLISNQIMDEGNFTSRRTATHSYFNTPSTSAPIRPTTPSRKYPNSSNDPMSNRYQSNLYPSSNRSYVDSYGPSRTGSRYDGNSSSERAQSYDDLLNERHSYNTSIYNSNTRLGNSAHHSNGVQQTGRRENHTDFDDDLIVKSTDLSATHEQEMLDLVRVAFRKYDIANQRELAGFLKRSADKTFSSCWHCIVGRQFSSYVTHEMNGFIYLTKGPLSILLFKSGS